MRMLFNSVHAHTYFLLKHLIQVYESFFKLFQEYLAGFKVQQPSRVLFHLVA